ncbi:hypothetical protein [Aquimarina spinulae]|uniref:hypothetical protein n=1 Tax=Aquimarina spinulae TaxID=1192023 RepID=UPI000D55B489|nr:hypothetical protein [Aquimarina spinulae]
MNFKKTIAKIFLDLIPVAIGVYVGILGSNWNENLKTIESKDRTIESIKKEIEKNKSLILEVKDYHVWVNEKIKKMPRIESPKDTISLDFWRGLRIPRLQKSAYQTAIQTGIIGEIKIDLLEKMNEVYLQIDLYNQFRNTAMQGLYANDFSDIKNFNKIASFLGVTMVDLYYLENEIIEKFKTCLSEIDKTSKE